MFIKKNPEHAGLDRVINDHLASMLQTDLNTDAYAKSIEQLSKLYKLKETHAPKGVSADTIAIVAGNLAGIVLILSYERLNVITSKALSFVMKLR